MIYAVSSCQVCMSAIFHYISIIHNYEATFAKFLSLKIFRKKNKTFFDYAINVLSQRFYVWKITVFLIFFFQNSHYCDSKGSWFVKLTGIVKFEYECENEKGCGHINGIIMPILSYYASCSSCTHQPH